MPTRSQIQALRLAGLGLSQPRTGDDVAALVAHLGAIQAQDYDGSLGSLGLRLSGSSIRQIQSAIASAQIVRSWPMRGTLHWMAAADVRWMLKLMTPRIIAASAVAIGAKCLWQQLGVVNADADAIARAAGLDSVMDRCVKIEHARLFGGLHWAGVNTGVISARRAR